MVWRIGGLLVVSGAVLALLLSSAFVVVGFGCMFVGSLVLAVALESTLQPIVRSDSVTSAVAPSERPTQAA